MSKEGENELPSGLIEFYGVTSVILLTCKYNGIDKNSIEMERNNHDGYQIAVVDCVVED
jgi:hypothetical protein